MKIYSEHILLDTLLIPEWLMEISDRIYTFPVYDHANESLLEAKPARMSALQMSTRLIEVFNAMRFRSIQCFWFFKYKGQDTT